MTYFITDSAGIYYQNSIFFVRHGKNIFFFSFKVPYEILNKKFRMTQKTLDRELNALVNAATELEKGLDSQQPIVGQISKLLDGVVEKLQILKRKAEESISEELSAGFVCKRRLEHLKQNIKPQFQMRDPEEDPEESQISIASENQWKKIRLNRLIVEHFLRLGYYDTAEILANRSGIREISNVDIFQVTREVEKDLSQHHTAKCIMWCIDNKSKLRKINSDIEFKLRQQEFIEMIRSDQRLSAVKHAQKYFPAFEQDQLNEIKKTMALLAFQTDTELEPYKTMFDIKRWDDLLVNFRLENYRLFQIPTQSVLSVAVQTGLSALKTPVNLYNFITFQSTLLYFFSNATRRIQRTQTAPCANLILVKSQSRCHSRTVRRAV